MNRGPHPPWVQLVHPGVEADPNASQLLSQSIPEQKNGAGSGPEGHALSPCHRHSERVPATLQVQRGLWKSWAGLPPSLLSLTSLPKHTLGSITNPPIPLYLLDGLRKLGPWTSKQCE